METLLERWSVQIFENDFMLGGIGMTHIILL